MDVGKPLRRLYRTHTKGGRLTGRAGVPPGVLMASHLTCRWRPPWRTDGVPWRAGVRACVANLSAGEKIGQPMRVLTRDYVAGVQ